MMHSQFFMAWFQRKRIIVKGYEISTPSWSDWGTYTATSYDVGEVMLAAY